MFISYKNGLFLLNINNASIKRSPFDKDNPLKNKKNILERYFLLRSLLNNQCRVLIKNKAILNQLYFLNTKFSSKCFSIASIIQLSNHLCYIIYFIHLRKYLQEFFSFRQLFIYSILQ